MMVASTECGVHWAEETCIWILVGKPEFKRTEYLGTHETILLREVIGKQYGKMLAT
jgi:hypothetical protein